jgi:hypothetical protein
MITCTINTEAKPTPIYGYPKLMYYPQWNMIILMTSLGEGFVINQGSNPNYYVGYHSKGWDRENIKDYNEAVTLQNKPE